jgi:hypothetical protein
VETPQYPPIDYELKSISRAMKGHSLSRDKLLWAGAKEPQGTTFFPIGPRSRSLPLIHQTSAEPRVILMELDLRSWDYPSERVGLTAQPDLPVISPSLILGFGSRPALRWVIRLMVVPPSTISFIASVNRILDPDHPAATGLGLQQISWPLEA